MTIEDFYSAAEREQIEVVELRLKARGYCLSGLSGKGEFIFLKKGQDALKLIETAYHELFHLICGCSEFEANAFRLIALIPISELNFDWLEEHPTAYAYQLWKERMRLYFLYGV